MIILLITVGFFLIIALLGFLLPRNVHVSRSIEINASQEIIFNQISDLENFKQWNPWAKKDPNIQITIKGQGVGSSYHWKGNKKVREGKLTIIKIQDNQVYLELDFGFKQNSYSSLIINEKDSRQSLSWTMDVDMGNNPTSRYTGLFMNKFIGNDYEAGLKNVKTICETPKL